MAPPTFPSPILEATLVPIPAEKASSPPPQACGFLWTDHPSSPPSPPATACSSPPSLANLVEKLPAFYRCPPSSLAHFPEQRLLPTWLLPRSPRPNRPSLPVLDPLTISSSKFPQASPLPLVGSSSFCHPSILLFLNTPPSHPIPVPRVTMPTPKASGTIQTDDSRVCVWPQSPEWQSGTSSPLWASRLDDTGLPPLGRHLGPFSPVLSHPQPPQALPDPCSWHFCGCPFLSLTPTRPSGLRLVCSQRNFLNFWRAHSEALCHLLRLLRGG